MKTPNFICAIALSLLLATGNALAFDCSDLPEWKRQRYYLLDDEVQYLDVAYVNRAESSKRDKPDPALDFPWESQGPCEPPDGGGGDGGGGGGGKCSLFRSTASGIVATVSATGARRGARPNSTLPITGSSMLMAMDQTGLR